jgi:hypothetical protein
LKEAAVLLDGSGGGSYSADKAGNIPLTALSKMMIDSARSAVADDDYVNALRYVFAVASVDKHRDITTALVVTVLDVVDVLELARGALSARASLLRWLMKNDGAQAYEVVRGCFSSEVCLHILRKAEEFSGGEIGKLFRFDEVSERLVYNVNKLAGAEDQRAAAFMRAVRDETRGAVARRSASIDDFRLVMREERAALRVAVHRGLEEIRAFNQQQSAELKREYEVLAYRISKIDGDVVYSIRRSFWIAPWVRGLIWVILASVVASVVTSFTVKVVPPLWNWLKF